MKLELFTMLKTAAEADKAKALLTLNLLSDHPVGIGDHSTDDFYKNADEAFSKLVEADDKLKYLKQYFKELKQVINE